MPLDKMVILDIPAGRHLITGTIKIARSVFVRGQGSRTSVLAADGAATPILLSVGPRVSERTTLAKPIKRGGRVLALSDSMGIWKGYGCSELLIRDESQVWPHDPRDYVFKGELNCGELILGDRVRLREPARDDYTSGNTVEIWRPSEVFIRGVGLEFEKAVLHTKAVAITGASPVRISDVAIARTGRVGIWVEHSSNVQVEDSQFSDGFPMDCDTCYGIQTYGCQDVTVRDNHIFGYRRGVDISGTLPSRRVVVSGNAVVAESDTSRAASGLGTHGSAEGVIFSNNEIHGGIVGLMLRGDHILVENNAFIDPEWSGVYLSSGGTHYVINNELGGWRTSGVLTNRGVEFNVPVHHELLQVEDNRVTAKVGVRLSQTPSRVTIRGNQFDSGGDTPVVLKSGVKVPDQAVIEYEW
ncbi:MAG: right-handed parallel beta-helix repeat-containing protein [Nannocystaceae bacterium]